METGKNDVTPATSGMATESGGGPKGTVQDKDTPKGLVVIGVLVLAILIVGGYAAYSFWRGSSNRCYYNGAAYKDGDTFASVDGCNTCTCEGGSIACTEMACAEAGDTDEEDDMDTSDDTEGSDGEDNDGEEATEKTIEVYLFDRTKFDDALDVFVTPVERTTTREDVATFGVEQVIAGPTAAEEGDGLEGTFGEDSFAWFTSTSNCGGKDFTVMVEGGLATVQFCRSMMLAGDMSGWVVGQQISETVKQFSSVDEVVILNVGGNCFDDMSGLEPEECTW